MAKLVLLDSKGVGVIKQKPLVIFSLSHFVTQLSIFWLFDHFFFFFYHATFWKRKRTEFKEWAARTMMFVPYVCVDLLNTQM